MHAVGGVLLITTTQAVKLEPGESDRFGMTDILWAAAR
jgi:hypothetical protein